MEGLNSLNDPVLRFNGDDVRALMRFHRMQKELVDKHGQKEEQSDVLSSIRTDNQAEKKRIEAEIEREERKAVLKELRLTTSQDAGRGIDCHVSEEELQEGLQFYLETPVSSRPPSNVSSASTLPAPYEFRPVTSFLGDSSSSASTSRETSPLLRASGCRRGVRFFSPVASAATTPYQDFIDEEPPLLEAPTAVIQLAELGPVKMDEFEREYWQNFLLRQASRNINNPQKTEKTHFLRATSQPNIPIAEHPTNMIVPEGGIFEMEP